jgi:hypothetical protein
VVQASEAATETANYRSAKLGDDLMRRITVAHVEARLDAVLGGRVAGVGMPQAKAREAAS